MMSSNAVIYTRVSTDEQGKGFSLPTQLEACRKHAVDRGYVVVAEYTEDYTGSVLDRPELTRLRDMVASGAIQTVVVYDMDRMSRKAAHQMYLEEEFKKAGVAIDYVIGDYTDSPEGTLHKQIRAVIAEYEREKIKERTLRGKRGRAQAGSVLVGRVAPYGYDYDRGERSGSLRINEDEAAIVRQIFHWYVNGDETGKPLGRLAIANRLSQVAAPTKNDLTGFRKAKKGYGIWSKSTVGRMLTSEVYAGTWYYNRHQRTSRTTSRARDRRDWIPVNVPAIIDRELWDAAQQRAHDNRINSPRNTKHDYLMRGRLRCADCGLLFRARTEPRGKVKGYYSCGGQKIEHSVDFQNKPCHRSLRQEDVDDRVWERIKTVLLNPALLTDSMRQKQAEISQERQLKAQHQANIDKQLDLNRAQQGKLLRTYLADNTLISETVFASEMTRLRDDATRLEQERDLLAQDMTTSEDVSDETIKQVEDFCENVRKGIEAFTFADKLAVVEILNITGIVYRGVTRTDDTIVLSGFMPDTEVDSSAIAATTCS